MGKTAEIRIPLITKINDDQMGLIGRFLASLKHITKVKVLAYHNFASAKYDALDIENTLLTVPLPDDAQLKRA